MTEDEKIKAHYPDLLEAGGLLSAMRAAFQGQYKGIQVNGFGTGLSYAHVQHEQLSAQVFIGLDERRFDFDFWAHGRKQASGSSANLEEVKTSIAQWLSENGNLDDLVKMFPFVTRK